MEATKTPVEVPINTIRKFFGYTSATAFAHDWKLLSDRDKDQIRRGIGDGSLTY